MSGKKQTRSTKLQLSKLIQFMATNKNFANGEYTGPLGQRRLQAQWSDLCDLLNQNGPQKSMEQWKQTWRDLKRKARKENAEANQARGRTGNDTNAAIEVLPSTSDHNYTGTDLEIYHDIIPSQPIMQPEQHPIIEPEPQPIVDPEPQQQTTCCTCKRRLESVVPSSFIKLQEEQNQLLKRMCGLIQEKNKLMRELIDYKKNKK